MRLIAVIFALLLLSACAVQQIEPKIVEVNKTVEINKTKEVIEPKIEPKPAPKVIAEPIADAGKVNELLADINENIESYSFVYEDIEVFVLGNKMGVKFDYFVELSFEMNNERVYITDAYIDTDTGKAVAYCDVRGEERIVGTFNIDRSRCKKIINVELNVSKEDIYVKTPVDWLLEFKDVEPDRIELNDQILKRQTGWHTVNPVLHFDTPENRIVVIRIDKSTKLPARVEVVGAPMSERIDYDYLVANRVLEEDVVYKEFIKQDST